MKQFRTVLGLAVLAGFALCALVGNVNAQDKKAKGKITEIKKDGDKVASVTIEVKKKDVTEKKTFKLSDKTKVEKAGEKKDDKATAAEVKDLAVGQVVTVTIGEGDAATAILIAFKK